MVSYGLSMWEGGPCIGACAMNDADQKVLAEVTNSIVTKNMMSTVIKVGNKSDNSMNITQVQSLDLNRVICNGCGVKMGQKSDSELTLYQETNAETLQQASADMLVELQTELEAGIASSSEMGAPSLPDQENISKILNEVESILEVELEVDMVNEAINRVNSLMEQKATAKDVVVTCNDPGEYCFDMTQDGLTSLIAKQIGSSVQAAVATSKVVADVGNELEATTSAKATGFAGMFKALSGPMMALIIGGVLVLIILGVVFMQSGGIDAVAGAGKPF